MQTETIISSNSITRSAKQKYVATRPQVSGCHFGSKPVVSVSRQQRPEELFAVSRHHERVLKCGPDLRLRYEIVVGRGG